MLNLPFFSYPGHLFDLNRLIKDGGYAIQGTKNKLTRLNVCGAIGDAGCGGESGECEGLCFVCQNGQFSDFN